jgi:hypothetical protein
MDGLRIRPCIRGRILRGSPAAGSRSRKVEERRQRARALAGLERLPVRPGNSDLCFWPGPIEDAIAHLAVQDVEVETGPVTRLGA